MTLTVTAHPLGGVVRYVVRTFLTHGANGHGRDRAARSKEER